MTREERLTSELKKCRDLLDRLDMEIGTFTALDIKRDLDENYLDDVEAAVTSADEALNESS